MSDKQKIAFLCHPYHRGGVTRWMADAAIACARNGHEVYFITVAPVKEFVSAKGRETLLQLLTGENNPVRIIKAAAGREFEFGTAAYRSYVYKKLLAKLPPGTPVVPSDDMAVWDAAASLYESYPVIGVLHADESYYYKLAEKYSAQAAALVCVSGRVNKTTRARVPSFDPARIYTIPCGINLPPIDFSKSANGILQLVYAGRISDYQKRTADLVYICALLAKGNTPFHLHIIGDGEAKDALENKFAAAGLQQHVTFYGWLSQAEVTDHLSRADILLLTSAFEGMPIAMMEALAAGCGVAGTRVSGIEDYEHHPLSAHCLSVFAVGDMEDAAHKINIIAAIPKNIRQQAARSLAASEFSMEVCLDRYFKVIAAIKTVPVPPPKIRCSVFKLLYSNLLSVARNIKVRLK